MKTSFFMSLCFVFILSGCTSISAPTIQHTSVLHIFPKVSFYVNQTGQMQKLVDQGVMCTISTIDDSPGGNSLCINVPGYLHHYTIPKLNISISGSQLNQGINMSLFESSPEMPLVVSGNRLYDRRLLDKDYGYIEYVANPSSRSIDQIIDELNGLLTGGYSYVKEKELFEFINGPTQTYLKRLNKTDLGGDGIYTIYYFSDQHPNYYYKFQTVEGHQGPADIFGRGTRLFVDN